MEITFSQRGILGAILTLLLVPAGHAESLSLDEAFRRASNNNPDLSVQKYGVEKARSSVDITRSKMLPSLALKGSLIRQEESANAFSSSVSPSSQNTTFVTLTQSISALIVGKGSVDARLLEKASSEELVKRTQEELYLSVSELYITIKSLETELADLAEQIGVNKKRAADIKKQLGSTRARASDYHSTQSQVYSLEAQRESTHGLLASYRQSLAILCGVDANVVLATDPKELHQKHSLEQLLLTTDSSPRVRAATLNFEAAGKDVTAAKLEFLPNVSASADYYFERPGSISDVSWSVGLNLSIPLYSGGETNAKLASARASQKIKEASLAREKNSLHETIASLFEQQVGAVKQIEQLRLAVESAERAYQSSLREYTNGTVNDSETQKSIADYFITLRSLHKAEYSAALLGLRLGIYSQTKKIPAGDTK